MHRCLSCNRTCSMSSIFCDACRDSLLERSAEAIEEEQPELVKAGNLEGGVGEMEAPPQLEATATEAHGEQEQVFASAQTDEKCAWPFETSGIHTVEVVEEVADNMDETDHETGVAQATNLLAVPLPARRAMPRGVRRALLLFCVVGVLALLTDGVLLALSIGRHHSAQFAQQDQSAIMHQITPIEGLSMASPTPSVSQLNEAGVLLLSSSRLEFSATQGQTSLPSQTVTFSGGSQNTFSWFITPETTLPSWLHLSAKQGNAVAGVTAAVMVSTQPAQLAPGTYTTTLLVKAFNNHGNALADSPETLTIALSVRAPCTLNVTPEKLSFAAVLVSGPSPQTLTLSESTSCAFPVSWQVSADTSWVIFSNTSGTDASPGGSIVVQASSSGKLIGSYTAHISLQATDSSGAPVTVSPVVITVTLTVIG